MRLSLKKVASQNAPLRITRNNLTFFRREPSGCFDSTFEGPDFFGRQDKNHDDEAGTAICNPIFTKNCPTDRDRPTVANAGGLEPAGFGVRSRCDSAGVLCRLKRLCALHGAAWDKVVVSAGRQLEQPGSDYEEGISAHV